MLFMVHIPFLKDITYYCSNLIKYDAAVDIIGNVY